MKRHLPEVVSKARELRRQKLSFQEISRVLQISDSTIRNWCYDLGIDRHESLRINNEYRRNRIKNLDIDSAPLCSKVTPQQARFFAALLYGCEGCKYPATGVVAFVNSNPDLVRTFIELFRKGFKVEEEKFRVHLQIHNSHDFKEICKFWSTLLGISISQFFKPTVTTPRGKMRRQNYMGTCSLRYIDNRLQLRLLGIFEKFCANRWGARAV